MNSSTSRLAVDVFHAAHGCGGLHWAQIMALDVKRKLMVMPSNNSSAIVHYWAGRYDGRIGWLVGPSAMKKTKLRPWMPLRSTMTLCGAGRADRGTRRHGWQCLATSESTRLIASLGSCA